MHKNKKQKWIDAGYELFARQGAEGIHVERLARILELNKSGFYHYFRTPDNFIKGLFRHHQHVAIEMSEEIERCQTIDPDFFRIVVKFKTFVLVKGQLARRKNIFLYDKVLAEVSEITNNHLLPLWRKTFNLPDDPDLVSAHFSLFCNAFTAQVNIDNLTYEFLHDMMEENRSLMREVFKHHFINARTITLFQKEKQKMNVSVHN